MDDPRGTDNVSGVEEKRHGTDVGFISCYSWWTCFAQKSKANDDGSGVNHSTLISAYVHILYGSHSHLSPLSQRAAALSATLPDEPLTCRPHV